MITVAALGPEKSYAWQAARRYAPDAIIKTYLHTSAIIEGFMEGEVQLAIIPIYNTREGENKEYFTLLQKLRSGYWIDNVVLPVHLSLGVFDPSDRPDSLRMLVGRGSVFRQCEEYINSRLPDISLLDVKDLDLAVAEIKAEGLKGRGIIDSEEILKRYGLHILEREVAPHNRTRFAVLGPKLSVVTGYDATAIITVPLDDRVGMLVDILGEFSRRGINILDMRSENDTRTQKLQIYIEAEGHIEEETISSAVSHIEQNIIQSQGAIKVLGSFPRVDMRQKYIKSFGFIGTGAMSSWFADRLEHEGYKVLMTGRSTAQKPEEMIAEVDVVIICVPISATSATIEKYGSLIEDGKALILLAGESETTLNTALEVTGPGVEVMLVHNLWGPQAATMKDKNVVVVRTARSGKLCSEFEQFMYKHGADIYQDDMDQHDLLMGVGQKLPTIISVALAMTLGEHGITGNDISSHSTLTSLYGILAMARVHSQNPRTYAEIMATHGAGRKIVRDFAVNLATVIDKAESEEIEQLSKLIDANTQKFSPEFLQARMTQAKEVDEVLGKLP